MQVWFVALGLLGPTPIIGRDTETARVHRPSTIQHGIGRVARGLADTLDGFGESLITLEIVEEINLRAVIAEELAQVGQIIRGAIGQGRIDHKGNQFPAAD